MATFVGNPDYAFDLSLIDLNWYSRFGYASDTLKNSNRQVLGATYPDTVYIQASDGYDSQELDLLGFGIVGTPLTGITGGTIQFVAEFDLRTQAAIWYVSGVSISAASLYNAGLTATNSDELGLISVALAGDDTITLSNQADVMSGFAGNDTISGLAGNDILTGGAGADTIDGGTGFDIATYSVARSSASVSHDSLAHTLIVSAGADGTDVLRRVEQLKFTDGLASFTYGNIGAPVVANFNPATGWSSQDQFPRHVADVNGDGFTDIVGFGFGGVLVSFGSAGGAYSAASLVVSNFGQTAGWTNDNSYHRALADVNGDGRADIIGFGQAGTLISLAKADGSFDTPTFAISNFGTAQGWATQNGYARVVGDVNGDGKADIVGFGQAGTWVALGTGNGAFQTAVLTLNNFGVNQGWSNDTTSHRTLADVNGDGRADIIGFGNAGTYVALSLGNGTFQAAQLATSNFGNSQGWTTNDATPRFAADVNHDGFADLVGFGSGGTYIAFGKGGGFFTDVSLDVLNFGALQGWGSDNTFHRELADMNHDGLIDIVGFGTAGASVASNQGDYFG